jgi:hypothetical protein
MQNVRQEVIGNELVIRVDLTQNFGPSTSGKTNTVAKSGFAKIEHPSFPGAGFNLNVWKK